MLKAVIGKCLQVRIRRQTFGLVRYMILIHAVGLSIASRFLHIGWQKSMLVNF